MHRLSASASTSSYGPTDPKLVIRDMVAAAWNALDRPGLREAISRYHTPDFVYTPVVPSLYDELLGLEETVGQLVQPCLDGHADGAHRKCTRTGCSAMSSSPERIKVDGPASRHRPLGVAGRSAHGPGARWSHLRASGKLWPNRLGVVDRRSNAAHGGDQGAAQRSTAHLLAGCSRGPSSNRS